MKLSFTLFKTTLSVIALLTGQAYAATAFFADKQPLAHIGPIELSTDDLANGANAYRGWYENGGWQGDLIEYDVSSSGGLSTSIDLTGLTPEAGATATNWSALVQFAVNEAAAADYWDKGRKIITSKAGSQVAFRWPNLTPEQQKVMDLDSFNKGRNDSNILDFLRGERVNEYPVGNLRQRFTVLGDIIHSNPEYVGIPEAGFPDSSYVTFTNTMSTRAPRVYVGANDGMLHAFDAATGNEKWAYIPSLVINNLARLAGKPYSHTYFIDGGITIQDAFYDADWHTVLVSGLGSGGKGLFALDVTSADLGFETSTAGGDKKVIKELGATNDDDLGHIFGKATITQLNDDKWYIITGNGVSSVNGIAKLYLISLETLAVTTISTASGSAGAPNGLSAPALVDTNNDGRADIAFAGDIDGDMWKFDLSGSTSGSWKLAYKLYDGLASQPISTAPDVANHPQSGHLVLFGTGRLYTATDITDTSVQAMYGVRDTGKTPGTTNHLIQVLSADTDYNSGIYSEEVRTFTTTTPIDWATHNGWSIDLPAGERLLTTPQLRASRVKATITNPNGFSNWLMEMTFDEGGVADNSIYDLNRSGVLDEADRVDNNIDLDLDDLEDIPMSWKREDGNMSQVTIARISQGFDTLFLNFLNPPLVEPAQTGTIPGGIAGGHIDVDMDSSSLSGLGGKTDGHVHEYDDSTGRTFIDYFDLANAKLQNVDTVGIATSPPEEFIIIVANADLSPGSELTIGAMKINVVKYQAMIHRKLAAWDGVGALLDDDNNSLIFKLNQLQAAGGLVSTFDSRSIINGGLHATKTDCVNRASSVTNGRWRNGALIIQLVKRSHFIAGTPPLDRLSVQLPTDLKTLIVLTDGTQVLLGEDKNGNGVLEDNEKYGGLIATNNAEFLYEGSVFWHFKGSCYGTTTWARDVAIATGNVTEELFAEILKEAGFADIDELIAKLDSLDSCKDIDEKKGGCKKEYRELAKLYALSLLVNQSTGGGTTGELPPTGLDNISGSPVVIEGGVSEGGLTSGPNFDTGRRTWIDILPQ